VDHLYLPVIESESQTTDMVEVDNDVDLESNSSLCISNFSLENDTMPTQLTIAPELDDTEEESSSMFQIRVTQITLTEA